MFIRENRAKLKLQAGQPAYGVLSTAADPQFAELFGLAGFDYYMVDVIRACELVHMTPMVRIGSKDPKIVLQYLDAGMMGIMMPGLETVAEIRMLIDAVKYPPLGKRGMGITRASGYVVVGNEAVDYIDFSNEQTMVIPQFEDAALLDRFEEMIAQPGVDAVVIGPRDLSLNMGFPDGPNHPEVQEMIDSVVAICKKAGVAAGITAGSRADSAKQVARGATLILAIAQLVIAAGSRDFLPEG
jgi:4-hydroxy-2-oxoheptanedioate aldolase